jgi:high-affinity iron transporter
MHPLRHRPLPLRLGALGVVLLAAATARAAVSGGEADAVRRTLALLVATAEEYREAFDASGALARPLEYDEARAFLAEARGRAERLRGTLPADVEPRLAGLAAALEARAPVPTVVEDARSLGAAITAATGVAPDLWPSAAPSTERGRALFSSHCASCHGAAGAGDGPDSAGLARPPADFTNPAFMRAETPTDFFHVISLGRRAAAMPAWEASLSVQERWDLVSHLFSLATGDASAAAERAWTGRCAGCHGAAGDGRGPEAAALDRPVPSLAAPAALSTRSDQELFDALAAPTDPSAYRHPPVPEGERWQALARLRALSLGAGGDSAGAVAVALDETARLLGAAVEAHRRGDPTATDLATDAYLRFEPLEPRLSARGSALVRRVEEDFMRLRAALAGTSTPDVERVRDEILRDFEHVRRADSGAADTTARLVQSATIILREGIEIVLIVGALLTYVVKSGNPGMKRPIYGGVLAGLAASVAAAVVISTVLGQFPGAAEILEGATMLLAAVVLFWVSYWLVSKAEADHWQRYIQGKVRVALARGSGFALGSAAFLAVFREGCETVLFYQALFASAPAGDVATVSGLVAGAVLLAAFYTVFARFGLRIPIRPFFLATGALLYAMAIAFAGRGVYELQEAGVVSLTPVAGVPRLPFLGVFPSLESLLAQGVLVALLLYAVVVTLRRRREYAPAPTTARTSLQGGA